MKSISSLQPIESYVSDLLKSTKSKGDEIAKKTLSSDIPSWEKIKPTFDIDHTDISKSVLSPHILKS